MGSSREGDYLKYITQLLMEEDDENMPWETKDQLALGDIELSLYQALGEEYTHPLNQIVENPIVGGSEDHNPSLLQNPRSSDPLFVSSSYFSFHSTIMDDGLMLKNMFNDVESYSQFKRGYEEARKFIPKIDLDSNNFAANSNEHGIDKQAQLTNQWRGRKNRDREERDLEEERSTKQLASFVEDSELHELFDKILLFDSKPADDDETVKCGKSITKRQVNKDPIDLKDLLIRCACAVNFSDYRTSTLLLKKIRAHTSLFGDGSQRLAHYFANGLEARMDGSGTRIPDIPGTLASIKTTSADVMKAINCVFSALPHELSIRYANRIICKMAENAKAIHIVDFDISFGFQWPDLIELLSVRDGGPPKLRITGIEFPQRGFRPGGRVEGTCNLLARYCERFNVPFEFNCIALQDWKTLLPEKLKIDRDEMVFANNHYRFESLLDETDYDAECPRDAVLQIIRSMNPDIFVHSVVNGCLNSPCFFPRFKEALSYYSSVLDALDDTAVSAEEPAWLMYESQCYGPEIMNVVACEGPERNFRPESYKQWHARNLRAGFKPLPLDQELKQGLREQLKIRHHKNFSFDEDGPWILQGWKGKTTHAWSFWVRATPHL